MRGKVEAEPEILPEDGITPAYAGKRARSRISFRSSRDHPRLCGEKKMRVLQMLVTMGSPPPMRGKVLTLVFPAVPSRITPAYAGKSLIIDCRLQAVRDHPRLCGEKAAHSKARITLKGITPAYAGKSTLDSL